MTLTQTHTYALLHSHTHTLAHTDALTHPHTRALARTDAHRHAERYKRFTQVLHEANVWGDLLKKEE